MAARWTASPARHRWTWRADLAHAAERARGGGLHGGLGDGEQRGVVGGGAERYVEVVRVLHDGDELLLSGLLNFSEVLPVG